MIIDTKKAEIQFFFPLQVNFTFTCHSVTFIAQRTIPFYFNYVYFCQFENQVTS